MPFVCTRAKSCSYRAGNRAHLYTGVSQGLFPDGVTGTATSIGGPAIALLFQREPPAVMRSTLSVFFFVGVILSLSGLGISGSLSRESWAVALVLAPGVVAGMLVGRAVRDRIHRDAFRAGVLLVCTASAVTLLIRSLA